MAELGPAACWTVNPKSFAAPEHLQAEAEKLAAKRWMGVRGPTPPTRCPGSTTKTVWARQHRPSRHFRRPGGVNFVAGRASTPPKSFTSTARKHGTTWEPSADDQFRGPVKTSPAGGKPHQQTAGQRHGWPWGPFLPVPAQWSRKGSTCRSISPGGGPWHGTPGDGRIQMRSVPLRADVNPPAPRYTSRNYTRQQW